MDNRNRHNDQLGVNKIGKNIRKSPIHQPNFASTARQQSQPQVYNINKNDFRNIVQQLTGSPSQDPLPRPPNNLPKPPSMRLQKIRPPPLTNMNRPQLPIHYPAPPQAPPMPAPPPVPYVNGFVRPPVPFDQPSPTILPLTPGDSIWANTSASPVSAYMQYLQNSIMDAGPRQAHAQSQPQVSGQIQDQPPSSALIPMAPGPPFPSPRMNGPPLLPSPASQFLMPSPSGFLNLLSPRSPYPMLSPGYQFPPPLTPNFVFSPLAQSGILGPGPQPPLSPGIAFPLSPFPLSSPRWRDH